MTESATTSGVTRRCKISLTKLAAKATELGRSKHSKASLNFFSNSSDPIAFAAMIRSIEHQSLHQRIGSKARMMNAPIDICLINSCKRRNTRISDPSNTSVICEYTQIMHMISLKFECVKEMEGD
jgi:hypothetical protein